MSEMILELAQKVMDLNDRLDVATEEFAARVSEVEAARTVLNEAAGDLADITNELVYEATIAAKLQKAGPLHGIAASDSNGLKAARAQICKSDSGCRDLALEVAGLTNKLASAEAEQLQAEKRMMAMRTRMLALSQVASAVGNVA